MMRNIKKVANKCKYEKSFLTGKSKAAKYKAPTEVPLIVPFNLVRLALL
jgi:hypothetical protein